MLLNSDHLYHLLFSFSQPFLSINRNPFFHYLSILHMTRWEKNKIVWSFNAAQLISVQYIGTNVPIHICSVELLHIFDVPFHITTVCHLLRHSLRVLHTSPVPTLVLRLPLHCQVYDHCLTPQVLSSNPGLPLAQFEEQHSASTGTFKHPNLLIQTTTPLLLTQTHTSQSHC